MKLFLTVVLIFFTAMISACGISGESNGVIIGKNDFLFNMSADGYDYIADFKGKYAFTDDELDRIYNALNKRRLAYANNGI
ncbi:MAG: hypothetical protein PHZ09_10155, partial [Eubacteriales bacterium]|nr:hypothetical protein [Eubacteriales bacterium]